MQANSAVVLTQESSTSDRLRSISKRLDVYEKRIDQLTIHNADGTHTIAHLPCSWESWPGLDGVRVFHVPHPDDEPGPFIAICQVAAGVVSRGAHLDESRLVGLLGGELTADGHQYRYGQFLWIAPGQPSHWSTGKGYLAVIRYNVPPHDIDPNIDPDLLPDGVCP